MKDAGNFFYSRMLKKELTELSKGFVPKGEMIIAWDASSIGRYNTDTVILSHARSLTDWQDKQPELLDKAKGREIKYSKLGDAIRINALPNYLGQASHIVGDSFTLAMSKDAEKALYRKVKPEDFPPNIAYREWSSAKLFKSCVLGEIIGMFLTINYSLTKKHLIILDRDDSFWGNEEQMKDFEEILLMWLHAYGKFPISDILLTFDDIQNAQCLTNVCDLSAGAMARTLTDLDKLEVGGRMPLRDRDNIILQWMADSQKPFQHKVLRIDFSGNSFTSAMIPLSELIVSGIT